MHLFGRQNTQTVFNFDDIRSFTDEETVSALKKLADNSAFLEKIVAYFLSDRSPFWQKVMRKQAVRKLSSILKSVNSVDEFQKKIIFDLAIQKVRRKTVSSFVCTGFENLDQSGRYIFVSNHRDIVCDAAFFEAALTEHGLPTSEIAFGSNLLSNPVMETLIRGNKGCIVYRGLDIRAQYKEYVKFSAYIRKLLDENKSLWIAHRQGRSKDATHTTNPAVLKMFYLSQRQSGYSFCEYLNFCKIVPVAVSYERDPTAELIAKTLVEDEKDSRRQKSKTEDLEHIIKGIAGYKGDVHICVGSPIDFSACGRNADAAAAKIDRFIHSHLMPGPFHYLAYERMYGGTHFSPMYTNEDEAEFDSLYKNLKPEIYEKILLQYSNPVKVKTEAES